MKFFTNSIESIWTHQLINFEIRPKVCFQGEIPIVFFRGKVQSTSLFGHWQAATIWKELYWQNLGCRGNQHSLSITTVNNTHSGTRRPHTLQMFHLKSSQRSVNEWEVLSFITYKRYQWELGLRTLRCLKQSPAKECRLPRKYVGFKEKQIIGNITEGKSSTLLKWTDIKSIVICFGVFESCTVFISVRQVTLLLLWAMCYLTEENKTQEMIIWIRTDQNNNKKKTYLWSKLLMSSSNEKKNVLTLLDHLHRHTVYLFKI